jgi:hypothetical protein
MLKLLQIIKVFAINNGTGSGNNVNASFLAKVFISLQYILIYFYRIVNYASMVRPLPFMVILFM